MVATYVLFESASGYALLERVQSEVIGEQLEEVQRAVTDFSKFSKMVLLKAFVPFTSAENALENCNDISEGICNETLKSFLEISLPLTVSKKKKSEPTFELAVGDERVGQAIQDALKIKCIKNQTYTELLRGVRMHLATFIPELKEGNLEKAQRGLSHSYSRAKVKFNINRVDNMIIQSISLLDQLDKDLNTFSMRAREWYSWHFPELIRIVPDNYTFCLLARYIKNKSSLTTESLAGLTEITNDEQTSQSILDAANSSMGTDISDFDMSSVEHFTDRVVKLAEYRKHLHGYLVKKMGDVAPNLGALIGEMVGARLISHAGSLTNLAKYPASTVQILGAEKALFRALKTKGNTPKYGLIFHSTFIGRAGTKNKGRISRYLANKCSIASRIDCFSESPSIKFGEALKQQVEERLAFYDNGNTPRKNLDVMQSVIGDIAEVAAVAAVASAKKDKKKRKAEVAEEVAAPVSEKKKKKKAKVEA